MSAPEEVTVHASGRMAPAPWFLFSDPAYRRDPYPFYARLRREMPIFRTKQGRRGDGYYVSRFEDVMTLSRDTDRFANDKRNAGMKISWLESKLSVGLQDSMVMRDGEDHRRLRNLVHKAFTPTRIAALNERVHALTAEMLDAAEARGTFDVVADLAMPLPIAVISEMMGVDKRYRDNFHKWMGGIIELDGAGPLELIANIPNLIQLYRFLRKLIEERRRNKGSDLLSAMIEAEESGDRLSFDELVSSTLIILLAGHETTVNLIGSGTLALLEHPAELDRLRAEPALMDSAIEEMLRFANPVQINAPRYARQDTELCGVRIPRGAAVSPILAAANRDEAQFADPDRFDIGRSPNKHVGFGFGAHYCVGAPLARLEAKAVFSALLKRYSSIDLAVPSSSLAWRKSNSVRGLLALPVHTRR